MWIINTVQHSTNLAQNQSGAHNKIRTTLGIPQKMSVPLWTAHKWQARIWIGRNRSKRCNTIDENPSLHHLFAFSFCRWTSDWEDIPDNITTFFSSEVPLISNLSTEYHFIEYIVIFALTISTLFMHSFTVFLCFNTQHLGNCLTGRWIESKRSILESNLPNTINRNSCNIAKIKQVQI